MTFSPESAAGTVFRRDSCQCQVPARVFLRFLGNDMWRRPTFRSQLLAQAAVFLLVWLALASAATAQTPHTRMAVQPAVVTPSHTSLTQISSDAENGLWGLTAPTEFTTFDAMRGAQHEGLRVRIGGYGKFDVIHDFNAIGDTDQFDVATIPTDGQPGQNTRLHARQTRIDLDTILSTGTSRYRVFVEGDFFNANDTSLRLRHAFAEIRPMTLGQTWTTFMDEVCHCQRGLIACDAEAARGEKLPDG